MANPSARHHSGLLATATLALLVAAILPIWLVEVLPLYDYPNHLARLHLLFLTPESSMLFNYYQIDWKYLPNLALELFTGPLIGPMSADTAARVFICITFVLQITGVFAVNKALFGRVSPTVLFAFPLLYSQIFLMGFLSFLFGIGIFLLVFAAWVATSGWQPGRRLLLFSIIACLVLTLHLYALALYAVTVAGYEIGRYVRQRLPIRQRPLTGLFVGALQFVPAIILFFATSPTASATDTVTWSTITEKIYSWSYVIDFYMPVWQLVVTFALIGIAMIAVWRGWLQVRPELLFSLGFLFICFLAAPSIYLTSAYVTWRMPLAILFIAIPALFLNAKIRPVPIIAAAVIMTSLQLGLVTKTWLDLQTPLKNFIKVVDAVQPNTKVGLVMSSCGRWHQLLEPPYMHTASWAIIRREAFVPYLFAFKTQQPIIFKGAYEYVSEKLPSRIQACNSTEKLNGGEIALSLEPFKGLVDVLIAADGPGSSLKIAEPGHEIVRYGRTALYSVE